MRCLATFSKQSVFKIKPRDDNREKPILALRAAEFR